MLIGLLLVGAAALAIWGIGSMLFREAEPLGESYRRVDPTENYDEDNNWLSKKHESLADIITDPAYSSLSCNIHYSDNTETDYEY